MIPYVILKPHPTCSYDYGNLFMECDCIEDDGMDSHFIDYISNDMYEFCCKKYGHGIEVSSYDDFCNCYWKRQEYVMHCPVFEIRYFKNNVWFIWDLDNKKDDIYESYVKKLKEGS